eukprot:3158593-Rhodomonas_salina.1
MERWGRQRGREKAREKARERRERGRASGRARCQCQRPRVCLESSTKPARAPAMHISALASRSALRSFMSTARASSRSQLSALFSRRLKIQSSHAATCW